MKKKIFTIIMTFTVIIIATVNSVFAENYNYQIYDPDTKKSYNDAYMITTGRYDVNPNEYNITLYSSEAKVQCQIAFIDKRDSLLKGSCQVLNQVLQPTNKLYFWSELNIGNYNRIFKKFFCCFC